MMKLHYKYLEIAIEDVLLENGIDEETVPELVESIITRLEDAIEAHEEPVGKDKDMEEELSFSD